MGLSLDGMTLMQDKRFRARRARQRDCVPRYIDKFALLKSSDMENCRASEAAEACSMARCNSDECESLEELLICPKAGWRSLRSGWQKQWMGATPPRPAPGAVSALPPGTELVELVAVCSVVVGDCRVGWRLNHELESSLSSLSGSSIMACISIDLVKLAFFGSLRIVDCESE